MKNNIINHYFRAFRKRNRRTKSARGKNNDYKLYIEGWKGLNQMMNITVNGNKPTEVTIEKNNKIYRNK